MKKAKFYKNLSLRSRTLNVFLAMLGKPLSKNLSLRSRTLNVFLAMLGKPLSKRNSISFIICLGIIIFSSVFLINFVDALTLTLNAVHTTISTPQVYSAYLQGYADTDGTGDTTDMQSGFEWGTVSAPPGGHPNSRTSWGIVGTFSETIRNLEPETTYYWRAKARIKVIEIQFGKEVKVWSNWQYGEEKSFTTLAPPPLPSFPPSPCKKHNVWGWAWSSNIGWISFSCNNCDSDGDGLTDRGKYPQCPVGDPITDYGVDVDPDTGLFSGGAWSENIGWVSFESAHLADCPSAPCEARLDLDGTACGEVGQVCGWAGWGGWEDPYIFTKYEHYEEESFLDGPLNSSSPKGQTFTVGTSGPNEDHTAGIVSLKLSRGGFPGDVFVSIRETEGGFPAGVLCEGSIDGNTLSSVWPGEWVHIACEADLSANTQYAVVVEVPGADSSNYIGWYIILSGDYAGGTSIYWDEGTGSWKARAGDDRLFQIWRVDENVNWRVDSFIKLRGTVQSDGSPYGVSLNSTPEPSEFEGWAWGGDETDLDEAIIGWVSFNRLNTGAVQDYKVMTGIKLNRSPSATNLKVEQFNYCFRDNPPVRLSWTFTDDDPGDFQSAYQVQIDGTDTGKVYSSSKAYSPDLSFNTSYSWRAKVWDNHDAESEWSGWNSFATDPPWPEPDFTKSWCPEEPDIGEEIQFCSVFEEGICEQGFCSDMTSSADDKTRCRGAPCVKWEWDFDIAKGAKVDSKEKNPTHFYLVPGFHRARLTVTDALGHVCPTMEFVPANIPLPVWKEIPPF